ncbi:hypothetical protein BDZ97DRAFT_1916647 [Flammula alnicola]|nr:hypothetical protein BDZ97DRAFT_1916647 [Flammula alnicola]
MGKKRPQSRPQPGVKVDIGKCGDDYRYPIPKPKGDPWEVLLKDLSQTDRSQCRAWRDEVENLLIFAGLFSAVVTAFVIETYKGLLRDPNTNAILDVLSVIASRVGNPPNGSSTVLSVSPDPNFLPDPFSPTQSFVRVNIFFFISLVLSLSSALVGIVCLQWLREHQSYPGTLSPEQKFAMLHMRTEAFERWHVRHIFTSLPLLLQAALILFFAGITDFLWSIDHQVVIPVTIFIAITLLFLIMTTVLPTLQAFPLHHLQLQVNSEIPVECPYKSPQSRACRRWVTSSKLAFAISSVIFALIYGALIQIPRVLLRVVNESHQFDMIRGNISKLWTFTSNSLYKILLTTIDFLLAQFADKSLVAQHDIKVEDLQVDIFKTWRMGNWSKFDATWMSIRDTYFRATCDNSSWLYRTRDERNPYTKHYYDTMQGLRKAIEENFSVEDESVIFAAYYCAQDLPLPARNNLADGPVPKTEFDPIPILRTRNHYLSKLLRDDKNQSITHLSDILEEPTLDLLYDENSSIFLAFISSRDDTSPNGPHSTSKTFAEAQFRLLGYLYEKPHSLSDLVSQERWLDKPLIIQPGKLFYMTVMDEPGQPFTRQWASTLHSFFKVISDPSPDIMIEKSFHAHPLFQLCSSYFWRELWYQALTDSPERETLKQSISTLEFMATSLNNLLENPFGSETADHSHCLFYCASYYFRSFLHDDPESPELWAAMDKLHPHLGRYKERIGSIQVATGRSQQRP